MRDLESSYYLFTDNPNMQDDKRMTLEEFIRNNRGINDGSNLPTTFLTGEGSYCCSGTS